MRKLTFLLILAFFFFSINLSAQELHGKVLTESGRSAAFVTVAFKNSENKVVTNADGTFKIKATKLPDTLVFSATGFEPYKVVVTEKNISDPDFEVVLLNKRRDAYPTGAVTYGVSSGFGTPESRKASAKGKKTKDVVADSAITPSGFVFLRSTSYDYLEESGTVTTGASPKLMRLAKPSPDFGDTYKSLFFSDTNIAPRQGQLAKSKILTAGEVNDFNKWKMWEDYSENEFKASTGLWKMYTSHRFSLQLTNRNHDAVINEPVFLVNKLNGDTAWRAYTDNTGKAELWAGFTSNTTDKASYYITDRYGHSVSEPVEFSDGMNVLVVDRSCNVSNDVDIAFVVDATGSMGDEIEFLKLELEDVIQHTMDKYSSLNLRASSVFYRDKGDAYLGKLSGFSDNLLKTMNFIKLQRAEGGGDYPEAVDDALQIALNSLGWNKTARAKIIFLVLDAPPHADAVERIQKLTMKAAALGIRIVPVACSGTDKSTEFLLRSMALATNGTYTFLTDHSGVGGSHIEPTTDKYQVELLNNLLQRVIGQFLFAKDCNNSQEPTEQKEIKQPENILAVKIYPNPTNGRFTVESNKELTEMFITDFTGKILMRLTGNAKQLKWNADISNYPSGAYLVKYITAEKKWGAEKVILIR